MKILQCTENTEKSKRDKKYLKTIENDENLVKYTERHWKNVVYTKSH